MPSLARGASTFGFEAIGCLFWPARQDPIAPQARPPPRPYDNGGALLSPRQQRCSIVAVTAAGGERNQVAGRARGAHGARGKVLADGAGARARFGWKRGLAPGPVTRHRRSELGRAGEADPEAGGGPRRRGLRPGRRTRRRRRAPGGEGWGGKADPEAGGGPPEARAGAGRRTRGGE